MKRVMRYEFKAPEACFNCPFRVMYKPDHGTAHDIENSCRLGFELPENIYFQRPEECKNKDIVTE
jgi:hypothetical protein